MNKIYYKINTGKILHFDMRAYEKKIKAKYWICHKRNICLTFFLLKKYEVKKEQFFRYDLYFWFRQLFLYSQMHFYQSKTDSWTRDKKRQKKLFVRVCDGVREIDNRKVLRFFIQIQTGSNLTNFFFKYFFGVPHLATSIFLFFWIGCRNRFWHGFDTTSI